jgi:hypothetical protein
MMRWMKWTKSTKRNQYTHLCLPMHYLPRHPFLLPRPARPPLWLHRLAFLWSTSLRPDLCISIFVIILNFQAFSGDIHLKNAPLPAVKKQRAIVRLELLFLFSPYLYFEEAKAVTRGEGCSSCRAQSSQVIFYSRSCAFFNISFYNLAFYIPKKLLNLFMQVFILFILYILGKPLENKKKLKRRWVTSVYLFSVNRCFFFFIFLFFLFFFFNFFLFRFLEGCQGCRKEEN